MQDQTTAISDRVQRPGGVQAQRASALAVANERRKAIGETRRLVRALPMQEGMRMVASLLRDPSPTVLAMSVSALLGSIRHINRGKLPRILRDADVFMWDRRVHQLTDRQRLLLADDLESRAA
jgi:hypothetical protein